MSNVIKLKRKTNADGAPTISNLVAGELAINAFSGRLFLEKSDGGASIVEFIHNQGGQTIGGALDVSGNITVTGTVDGIDIATDVAANTAKATNATHTGQVTGATALILTVSAVTAQPASGAIVAADTIIINDGGVLSEATFTQMDTYFNSSLSFSGDPDQNLFLNVLSDSGTAVADTTTDTLSILGGTGISTAVTADALTITNDSPNATHTGDAAGATGLTLQVAAITGKTELTTGLAGTDELLISDAGVLKRMDISVMNAYFDANLNFLLDTTDTFTGTLTVNGDIDPNTTNTKDIGASGLVWANIWATTFHGTATTAQYSDLAEKYVSDKEYEVGTVLSFGGDKEVTQSNEYLDHRIAGIVSEEPAYLMNNTLENGIAIALRGRVPCKVFGKIRKGDLLVSKGDGTACAVNAMEARSGTILGKALEDFDGKYGYIEVVV